MKKMNENTKVTLTFGQLRKLVKESIELYGKDEAEDLCRQISNQLHSKTLSYDVVKRKLEKAGFKLVEYGNCGGKVEDRKWGREGISYALYMNPDGILATIEYNLKHLSRHEESAGDVTNFYWDDHVEGNLKNYGSYFLD